jgi:hypothetical protein
LIKRLNNMNRIEKLKTSPDFEENLDNLDQISIIPESTDDLPPEYCTYKDQGCELAKACLECPLPQCALDKPWGQVRLNAARRDRQIRLLFQQEKLSVASLAAQFSVSPRTVRRALAANPPADQPKTQK